jgi:hypothetical protein
LLEAMDAGDMRSGFGPLACSYAPLRPAGGVAFGERLRHNL